MSERYWAVVPAAGAGRRMGGDIPKQYLPLYGQRVIEHSLHRLLKHPRIEAVYLALSADDDWWPTTSLASDSRIVLAAGGEERCHSVLNALQLLSKTAAASDWVLVHDAARPCLRGADLDRLIEGLREDPVGGLLGVPVHDTMKQTDDTEHVRATIPRDRLWHAYTPQMFRLGMLRQALVEALQRGLLVTDDASAMELQGYRPRMIQGHADNIKITRPADLPLADFYLTAQSTAGE
ncbi:MAG: 2-C-methyl-D-erythritol 4-phosphate cytidylyltransferase [Gammaproteobacteria bacterium]|nr:2-C-methyl-D-erythritol 4-phosphate cytidylyltransferase [Gammaproteobacteria bacterium]